MKYEDFIRGVRFKALRAAKEITADDTGSYFGPDPTWNDKSYWGKEKSISRDEVMEALVETDWWSKNSDKVYESNPYELEPLAAEATKAVVELVETPALNDYASQGGQIESSVLVKNVEDVDHWIFEEFLEMIK